MMTQDEDAILKRIIKCYLTYQMKATAKEIIQHINSVNYGLQTCYTKHSLGKKIKYWQSLKTNWLPIQHYRNNKNVTVYYLGGK